MNNEISEANVSPGKPAEVPALTDHEFNRRNRKALKALKKGVKQKVDLSSLDIQNIGSVDDFLDEDDLFLCKEELAKYEIAQEETKLAAELFRIYQIVGIPDLSARTYFKELGDSGKNHADSEARLWLQADPHKLKQQRQRILMFSARRKAFIKKAGNKFFTDEDFDIVAQSVDELTEYPLIDVFGEIYRSRAEKMELINLQIEWLEEQKKLEEQAKAIETSKEKTDSEEELDYAPTLDNIFPVTDTSQNYSLQGWDLFWTTNHWSKEQNHLVPIPTFSREDTVECLSNVARDSISIKTSSVVRALEFHLQKNAIQKALATRNKYGADGIRDWVKIKRGRDRIFFNIPSEEQNRAIFFAAGRDIVYKNI